MSSVRQYLFGEKYSESWDPKIHGPHNYLQIFYVAAIIDKRRTTKHDPLEIYRNGITKYTRSSVTGTMNDGIPSTSSDSSMTSKRKNNSRDTFKFQMKNHCLSLKALDDELFRNNSEQPGIVLNPLKAMLNHEVDISSLRHLEYEMERVYFPGDYHYSEIGYCGQPASPYAFTQREQTTEFIISHFQ